VNDGRDASREVASAFAFRVRVYYEDTDAAGVVYYANYLRFMERARTEWLETLGFPLAAFERAHAAVFLVHRLTIDYRRPAALNDALDVTVEVRDRGASRLVLRQAVLRNAEVLTDATVHLACVDVATLRPRRMPAPLAAVLEKLH
jgi:acyl-CoA thioester hydrolase